MNLYQRALVFAEDKHKDQKRLGGEPYMVHPIRVAGNFPRNSDEAVVAILHDVLEDTDAEVSDLFDLGCSQIVVEAIVALTRMNGEMYFEFVRRALPSVLARRVKIFDILDNLRDIDEFKPGLRKRYEKALSVLRDS